MEALRFNSVTRVCCALRADLLSVHTRKSSLPSYKTANPPFLAGVMLGHPFLSAHFVGRSAASAVNKSTTT